MRKTLVAIGILAAGMVAFTAGPSEAWGHGRVFVGVGPYWGWGGWGYPGYYHGYPYGYPYGYPPAPIVVEQQPRVYIQQPAPSVTLEALPPSTSAEAPAPPPSEQAYWYYCPNSRDYYPNIPACSEAWVRVPARSR